MRAKEIKVIEGIIRDIEHDLKTFSDNRLTLEALTQRMQIRANDLKSLLSGVYPY